MGEAKARRERGVVIQCMGVVGRVAITDGPYGLYLKDADHEALGGQGFAEWTGKIEDAKVFPNEEHALEFHERQSRTVPKRPRDGNPNRPLMVFGVKFVEAPPPGHRSSPIILPGFEAFQ
jgi:hypothetical protein